MRERASSAGGRLTVDDAGRVFTATVVLRVDGRTL
jgi:signal transduction histidine kinase